MQHDVDWMHKTFPLACEIYSKMTLSILTFFADLEQGIGWIHRFNLFRVSKQANISTYMRAKMIKMALVYKWKGSLS